ncbi:MAG: hypothetical protein KKD86_16690 [Bacteroidetes bacterium]|nr:hypothetical protein [Bacteroidota bacterium]MBU1680463.1 hypothetical protein [Bacteroidota bacterium]
MIKTHLTSLNSIYDSAAVRHFDVVNKGMNDEDIAFKLQESRQKLIESRTALNSFNVESTPKNPKRVKTRLGKFVFSLLSPR